MLWQCSALAKGIQKRADLRKTILALVSQIGQNSWKETTPGRELIRPNWGKFPATGLWTQGEEKAKRGTRSSPNNEIPSEDSLGNARLSPNDSETSAYMKER